MLRRLLQGLTAPARDAPSGDQAEAASRRALTLIAAGDLAGAEAAAQSALRAHAEDPLAHLALGRIAVARGDADRAHEALSRALAIAPDLDPARAGLAALAQSAGRLDEALHHYRAALERHARSPKLLNALGALLIERGEFEEAAKWLAQAVEIAPDLPGVRENLSRALLNARDFPAVEAVERSLVAAEPDSVRVHFRLAHALLMQGKLDDGWSEYEWRLQRPGFSGGLRNLPHWDGGDPAGRTILVASEQGLGDAILFARFVPELARRGARVRFFCRPQLERLFRASLESDDIRVSADPAADVSDVDAAVHLLSLPKALGLGRSALAPRSRYLRADAALAGAWRERLAAHPGAKVGLTWAGNPQRAGDDSRSLAPELVAPLGEALGRVTWFSLQADHPPTARRPFAMVDWMPQATDLADTAALIAALDLVISVDTSVAHLAAAVGRPLWLLAPHNVCWRWEIGDTESPWYPGVRIFRAPGLRAWPPVIDAVGRALRELP